MFYPCRCSTCASRTATSTASSAPTAQCSTSSTSSATGGTMSTAAPPPTSTSSTSSSTKTTPRVGSARRSFALRSDATRATRPKCYQTDMKLSNNRMTNKKAEMMMMMMNPTNPKPTSATLCSGVWDDCPCINVTICGSRYHAHTVS